VPKIVDHEQRRAELVEALWRVIATGGMEAVTIRSVAAQAGWSRGIVEHYFRDRDELVLHAVRLACAQALSQVERHHRELVGREALRTVLLHDMALYGPRRQGARIWFGLISAAVGSPAVAAEMVRYDQSASAVLAEIIQEMIARGEAASTLDPRAEAGRLLAFNLALNLNTMLRPRRYTDKAVEAEVDDLLSRLKGGCA
jgi:AcrR family transcriptional regulator